jgi:hypothetical protein
MPDPVPDPQGRTPLSLQAAQAFRYIIAGLFALVLFGGTPSDSALPFTPSLAHADVSSAPGYKCSMMRNNGRFYLIDTNAQRICVYALQNEGLRLVSARRYDKDEQVFDSSMRPQAIESSNGATVEQVDQFNKATTSEVDQIKSRAIK